MKIIVKIIHKILYFLAVIVFNLGRWKPHLKYLKSDIKGVLVLAPHTSNWDAFLGVLFLARYYIPNPVRVAYKKEAIIFPFVGSVFEGLGGVSINRKSKYKNSPRENMLTKLTDELKKLKNGLIVITPEGTRDPNEKWNKGFYHIAKKSNTPIYLSKIDYKTKDIGIFDKIEPSENFEKDVEYINKFYSNVHAKYPKKFKLFKLK